jgi:DNA-binding IscR family transcriptional regulator
MKKKEIPLLKKEKKFIRMNWLNKKKILEIIKASEGPIKTVDCDNNCDKKDTCISKKLWCDLDNTLNEFFDNKTLKDLL